MFPPTTIVYKNCVNFITKDRQNVGKTSTPDNGIIRFYTMIKDKGKYGQFSFTYYPKQNIGNYQTTIIVSVYDSALDQYVDSTLIIWCDNLDHIPDPPNVP